MMSKIPRVYVHASKKGLEEALVKRLRRSEEAVVGSPWLRLDVAGLDGEGRDGPLIVVAPTIDCSPVTCRQLAERGVLVVVLAPLPRDSERRDYLEARAFAYLPMEINGRELVSVVETAAAGPAGACAG